MKTDLMYSEREREKRAHVRCVFGQLSDRRIGQPALVIINTHLAIRMIIITSIIIINYYY